MSETSSVIVELFGGPADGRLLDVAVYANELRVPIARSDVQWVAEHGPIKRGSFAEAIYRQRMLLGEPDMIGGAYVMDYEGTRI